MIGADAMVAGQGNAKVEFIMRADDAELLKRIANRAGTNLSELIRRTLYDHIEPLKRAEAERTARAWAEVEERRRLREWQGETLPK